MRVCAYCRAAVARTDRGLDTLGKVADLVPMESPLRLFADGQLGSQTFILVGMAQLRHDGGGLTQEWYAKFSGSWGWLAEAQGRYYMTFEAEGVTAPPLASLSPGAQVQLPTMLGALRTFTVTEIGGATYVAANGELPFRLVPEGHYRFADLSDGEGNFATIDYGDEGDTPTVYVGQQVTLGDLHISGGEIGPPPKTAIGSTRLACPNCNAPVDLQLGPQSLRAVCAYCNHLLDVKQGALAVLERLAIKASPRIPLGARGTFPEGEMTVIGFVGRSAQIEGDWYPFEEYLLYEPAIGFRWLVQSDGHWSYVQPVAGGAVSPEGDLARYEDVAFRLFQSAPLRVDQVLGEFYWQVRAGEQVWSDDYVAPPAMLSREHGNNEENWSLATYLTKEQIERAFGDKTTLLIGDKIGVAPNQPDPTGGVASPLTIAFAVLIALGILFAAMAPEKAAYSATFDIPAGTPTVPEPTDADPDPQPSNVFFSSPFGLEGHLNVELGFRASLSNNWAYVVASLVNVATGQVHTVDASMEYYSGFDGGESWSEGKDHASEVLSPVASGQYVVRLETQQGGSSGSVSATLRVRQGVFRGKYLGYAMVGLGIPFLLLGIYTYSFERRRWTNSARGPSGAPKTALSIVVGAVALLLMGIVVILKAFAQSSGDDDD